jgi:hypothetical protein
MTSHEEAELGDAHTCENCVLWHRKGYEENSPLWPRIECDTVSPPIEWDCWGCRITAPKHMNECWCKKWRGQRPFVDESGGFVWWICAVTTFFPKITEDKDNKHETDFAGWTTATYREFHSPESRFPNTISAEKFLKIFQKGLRNDA